MKSGVTVQITKEPGGYVARALVSDVPVKTYGRSLDELQARFVKEINNHPGSTDGSYHLEDINFTIDFRSFFEHYKTFHVTGSEADDWDAMETLGPAY